MIAALSLALVLTSASVAREHGFVYCPAYPCLCEPRNGELVINCRYLYLTELPKFLSFDGRIKELSLRKNSIRFLPDNSFRGLNIQSIDLTDNIVTKVDDGAFSGLENVLEELDMQVYAMEGLPIKALEPLVQLTKLRIVGCRVPKLQRDTFARLTQLKELHLISCRINDIEAGGIGILRNLQVLDLSGNNLKYQHLREISKLYDLRKLILTNNDIRVLGSNAFDHLLHLRHIDLYSNAISSIDRNAFKTLDYSLEFLSLEKNQIKNKALYSLKSLRNLRELNLAKNNLTKVTESAFMKLELLVDLDLEDNQISLIKSDSLSGTSKYLRTLKLSGNPIREIENGAFAKHSALKKLSMNKVKMSKRFKHFTFRGLERSLEELSLQNSSICDEDLSSLRNLTSLKKLALNSNNIKKIPKGIFQQMQNLEKIDLSDNKLSNIYDRTFDGLQLTLQFVNFQNNNISSISKCTFDGFHRLGDIRLGLNPLICDCRLGWLHNWLKMHYQEFQRSVSDWKCVAPPSHAKKPFRHLALSQLTCSGPQAKNQTCDWTVDEWTRPMIPIATDVVPSPMLPVDLLGTEVNLALDGSVSKVISAIWNCSSKHTVGGYRIVVRRTNDSYEERDVVVPLETGRYIFSDLMPGFEYEVCLTVLSDEEVPLGRDCQLEITEKESKTLGRPRHSQTPFLTLLWTYVAGSLAATLLFVTVAICIRRHRQKKFIHGFAPGYSAWGGGMMYGMPNSQATSSCYFNSTTTGYDDVDLGDASECCPSHGRCSAVSTFRRHLPANYIVTAADLNDDFYFHF
ncbi:platelet glycoprotein V-like [Haliotis cracherodii]|uniref:platelet glycoprotein V-like n=1 Tax=Haliotis cracherodii TaxID=6455 RepID=UPI0039EB425A